MDHQPFLPSIPHLTCTQNSGTALGRMLFRHRLLALLLCLAAFPLRGAEVSWFRQKPEDGLQPTARGVTWRPAGPSRELHTHFTSGLPAEPGSRVTISLDLTFTPSPAPDAPLDQIRIGLFDVQAPCPRDGEHPETTAQGFMVRLNPNAPRDREGVEMRFRAKTDEAGENYLNGSSKWKAPKSAQPGFDLRETGALPVVIELERRSDGSALARLICGHGMIENRVPDSAFHPDTLALSVTGQYQWKSLTLENFAVRVTKAEK
jgi:hypothetical protein